MATYFRKVIHIDYECSPNVQYAKKQIAMGLEPTDTVVVPGVLTWGEAKHRLATWDVVRKEIGLFGRFYQGAQLLLFPPDWLDTCERCWNLIKNSNRKAKAIGIDTADGGDSSSWAVVDELGVIELRSEKTPDTTDCTKITVEMMKQHNVPPEMTCFDTGGGGRHHADRLRKGIDGKRYNVRTVGFGRPVTLDPIRRLRMIDEKRENIEESYAYVSRRVEMIHQLSQLCDPGLNRERNLPGFAMPMGTTSGTHRCHLHGDQCLRAQLAVMPKMLDKEGRYKLPPKHKESKDSKESSLVEMISHSPDEMDAICVAVFTMNHVVKRMTAGVT
jgi:hypothetical protein